MELRDAIEELYTKRTDMRTWRIIIDAVADGTLIPADAVFQVREGYDGDFYRMTDAGPAYCDPAEAIELRSADAVRREVLEEAAQVVCVAGWADAAGIIRALIDPTKGGDDA